MIAALPVLMVALQEGRTVVVDELDAKLHPKLLRYVGYGFGSSQQCQNTGIQNGKIKGLYHIIIRPILETSNNVVGIAPNR